MFTHLAIGTALFASGFAALVAPSASAAAAEALITPGPQIELIKRQNNADYMGYVLWSGTWSSLTCDAGNTYYQSAGQWGCCSTGRAGCLNNIAIGCFNGNMIFRAASTGTASLTNSLITRPCSSIWTGSTDSSFTLCNTAFMFENDRDSDPKVNVVCGVSSLNWSYYRQRPAVTSSAQSPSRTPVIAATPSLTPSVSGPTAAPTPINNPTGEQEEKSESKAWIAGAVVGPIAGLALIGFGIFFFMRRKKNKNTNQHIAPATGSVAAPGATAYQQNTYPTNPGSPQPPQYYPNMQQNAGAAPFGVTKQDGYYAASPQSPVTSQGSQSPYGNAPQQWQQPGGQPVYGAPSPSLSPAPQNVQPAQYNVSEARPFSSELEASTGHGSPEVISVQPKR